MAAGPLLLLTTGAGLVAAGCLALWRALLIAGVPALTAAIGIHFVVGYVNLWHLAPAVAGAVSLVTGLALSRPTGPLPPFQPVGLQSRG